jgi:lipid-A-disaccharide synthase
LKLLLSAAESSSDAHGAELLQALHQVLLSDQKLEVFGVGGPRLRAAGMETLVRAEDLSVMGLSEVLLRLPRAYRALQTVSQAAALRKPDLAVVMDYPDFHFRLAKKLKRQGIPIVYYIPPKIWVWRKNRIHFLKKYFVKVLSILPFEEAYYRAEKVPFQFVGNPLIDELPWSLSKRGARSELGLDEKSPVLVVMPGSRPAELKVHFPLMIEAAKLIAEQLRAEQKLAKKQALKVLVPLPVGIATEPFQVELTRLLSSHGSSDMDASVDVRISQGDAHQCLVAADVGLIKSGTSTLEAGLLKCCHVVTYRPSLLTGWVFKNLIQYQGPVGLINWVAGWKPGDSLAVPELLCERATPQELATEGAALFLDQSRRTQMEAAFDRARRALGLSDSGWSGESPSHRAALEVLRLLQNRGGTC